MATIVFFHAHPDDEALSTGGSIARASHEGHRVVLAIATNGEHGDRPDDLADGETLIDRRHAEARCSAEALGIARTEWLGYRDSGMHGWSENDHPQSFWRADVDEAGGRLAALLEEESADVLVTYDWHGGYGHPDHVKVHRVGHRAAELAGTPSVFEVTYNRDAIIRSMETTDRTGPGGEEWDPASPMDDGNPFGTTEDELHLAVDVSDYVHLKQRAIRCHASQVSDAGFFAAMPDEQFAASFSTEWYIRPGAPQGLRTGWLLDAVADWSIRPT